MNNQMADKVMTDFKYGLIYDDTPRPKWWKHPIKWWKFQQPLIAWFDLDSYITGSDSFEITFPKQDEGNE
jgi:hypothetical protein